jgi:hypothetical protein
MKNITFVVLIYLAVSLENTSNFLPAMAQISPKIQLAEDLPTPPTTSSPRGGRGSGTRGPCEKNTKLGLEPLVPLSDGDFSGLTLKEHPTFWFYVPYQTDSISKGEFVLEDLEGNIINQFPFTLPKIPGFVSVSIPNTGKPLEKNQEYSWRLTLHCSAKTSDDANHDSKQGLIKRVDLATLETQLKTAKPEERLKLYIDNKIWYDAAHDFANNKENREAWFKLLEAIDLEALKQEPIGSSVVLSEK